LKKLTGAKKLREGKGSHEIWRTPECAKFPVPRHPRDLNKGTLSKIIKQAGLDMGLTEFINMKV
jgi:predicted RNA binding protein YcfA (HicA-like mRNA interferase family)